MKIIKYKVKMYTALFIFGHYYSISLEQTNNNNTAIQEFNTKNILNNLMIFNNLYIINLLKNKDFFSFKCILITLWCFGQKECIKSILNSIRT